jgi:UDP-4-amino-4,6-dideoxy-N-acetyl-beta-L-altrosamine transaminase/dTDP-4-dehydrorhamnose reductase
MKKNRKKMLITGISGLLGNNLAYYFKDKYDILGLYSSHLVQVKGVKVKKVDILSKNSLRKIISDFRPDIVIHCASLTNVDFCEVNKGLTKKINVDGTKNVVNGINDDKAKLIYISTDSVYDGEKGNFVEDGKINPKNYYGVSKYQGELEVSQRKNSLILRTNIFGWNIQNKFSIGEWIINQLASKHRIKGFKDAIFSSIYTFELAKIIDLTIKKDLRGLYNCASRDSLSKFQFAKELARRFNLDTSLITPILIGDFGFKAKRGKNLSLNVDKLSHDLKCGLPTIKNSIDGFYFDFKDGLPEKIRINKPVVNNTSMSEFIPYGRQSIDENDIRQVVNVLRSDWITQGPKVNEFERELCKYTGAKYAVSVSSGTAALHCACLAAGIGRGDEVITSPLTFVASSNCVLYCGGRPVFADIQPDTANIDPESVKTKITLRTKALIPVHYAGHPCDMRELHSIARKKKLVVIEDAAHALGAEYRASKIGSCKYSDMTIFSFHPVKHITTGEGGAILTNNKEFYSRLVMLRSHGITRDSKRLISKQDGAWSYEMQMLGFNYRITDFQCALGLSQLKKINQFIDRRREIARLYRNCLFSIPGLKMLSERKYVRSAYHLFVVLVHRRKKVFERLRRNGILVNVHYKPVYLQPYYRENGYANVHCPCAEDFYAGVLSIPMFPRMKDRDVYLVSEKIKEALRW